MQLFKNLGFTILNYLSLGLYKKSRDIKHLIKQLNADILNIKEVISDSTTKLNTLNDNVNTIRNINPSILSELNTLNNNVNVIKNINSSILSELNFNQRFQYEKRKDKNKKSILFFANLNYNGGIEERLFKQINIMKKLYNIFVVTPSHTYNYSKIMMDLDIFVYTIDVINNNSLFIENYLRKIIAYHNINFTCFEAGYFNSGINYYNLRIGNNKLILILHEAIDTNHYIYNVDKNPFNDIFVVRKNNADISYKNKYIFANGVLQVKNYYQINKSNKILIATRIDGDKFQSIKALINFAKNNNLEVDIAGKSSVENDEKFEKQRILFLNHKVNYIDYIDTVKYLKENYNKYLFIAGVGQFIMEGISLGFPSLFTTNNGNMVFVNKDNFLTLYEDNFSPSIILEGHQSNVDKDLSLIIDGNIQKFCLIEEAKKYMLFKDYVHKFIEIIENYK